MLAESLRAEVNALATTLTHLPGEGIAVGSFEGDTILPQRRLGGADVIALLVSRHVVAGLRDKPRRLPADVSAGVLDDLRQALAVVLARKGPGGIVLVGVAFSLVPEHRSEAVRPHGLHPRDELGIGGAIARPRAVWQPHHPAFEGRRIGKRRPFRQPLPHARRADTAGDESYWHVEPSCDRVAERWHEASHRAAGAGLRIIGEPPRRAVEGGDASALRHLPFLAVIGRVGLAGDDKYLADTDVRDAPPAAFPSGMHHPDIEPPPAARG